MAKPITINVTAEHIAAGSQHAACDCPVALALLDAGMKYPYVWSKTLQIVPRRGKYRREYRIPAAVRTKIKRFDDGKKIRPFSFQLTEEIACPLS